MKMAIKLSSISIWIIAVYELTENNKKFKFMSELISCQPTGMIPWLCLDEFNLTCEAEDKNNNNINRRQMRDFRQSLDASELLEIKLINRKFTWSNNQSNPTLVHLDYIFCNIPWDNTFVDSNLMALSSSLSNHYPLFLCNRLLPLKKVAFRFERF
jgi:hypothetical protein